VFAIRVERFLIVAVALLTAAALLTRAGIAPAGGAESTSAASVVITDGRVAPTVVTIVVGGKVTWTNHGSSSHVVVAKNNAFVGFTLQPLGARSVRFPKAGRFPYLVDGRMAAIVIVGLAAGGAGSGGGSSTTKPSSQVAHYEVDISVTIHEHETGPVPPAQYPQENWDATIEWTGKWADVSYPTAPDAIGVRPRPGGVFLGTIQASDKVTFFHLADPRESSVQCKGDISRDSEAARLVFSGRYLGASGGMNFASGPVDGGKSFWDKLNAIKASCSEPEIFLPYPNGFDFTSPDGINFSLIPAIALNLQFDVTSTTKIPFPLDHLIAGQSFGIETGTQTRTTSGGGTTRTADEAVSVQFKART
jgi:plastocyanin